PWKDIGIERLWEARLPGLNEQLPEGEWRYFVIAFGGTNDQLINLERAFAVGRKELEIGFTAIRTGAVGGSFIFHPGHIFQVLQSFPWEPLFIEIAQSDVAEPVEVA